MYTKLNVHLQYVLNYLFILTDLLSIFIVLVSILLILLLGAVLLSENRMVNCQMWTPLRLIDPTLTTMQLS